jgi:aspartate/methionine/tyrosine aminotransferase
MAGAQYVPVPLELKNGKWMLDIDNLKKAITSKTKVIILNNAHNPTGKLFTREELEGISKVIE